MTTTSRSRNDPVLSAETIAANAAYEQKQVLVGQLAAKGGRHWLGDSAERVYFARSDTAYKAEVDALRAAAGGTLAAWPSQKLGYYAVAADKFVSTRDGVSDDEFKLSIK